MGLFTHPLTQEALCIKFSPPSCFFAPCGSIAQLFILCGQTVKLKPIISLFTWMSMKCTHDQEVVSSSPATRYLMDIFAYFLYRCWLKRLKINQNRLLWFAHFIKTSEPQVGTFSFKTFCYKLLSLWTWHSWRRPISGSRGKWKRVLVSNKKSF